MLNFSYLAWFLFGIAVAMIAFNFVAMVKAYFKKEAAKKELANIDKKIAQVDKELAQKQKELEEALRNITK